MYKRLMLFFVIFFPLHAEEKKSSFLVSEAPSSSKNELKEDIGEELKKTLFTCTAIASELGNVQRELAALQHRVLSQVESLVENKRCFKKAKKTELSEAFSIMNTIKQELTTQKESIKKMALQMNKSNCLKEAKG
jgi:hypothetical protein